MNHKHGSRSLKSFLTKERRDELKKRVEDQLRIIHPPIQKAIPETSRQEIPRDPDILRPEWYGKITRRLSDQILPHSRRGSISFQKGRNDGFLLGGLLRDLESAKAQGRKSKMAGYVRELNQDVKLCETDSSAHKATLTGLHRRGYVRGFEAGKEWAKEPVVLEMEGGRDVLLRLWHEIAIIKTTCPSIPELFRRIYDFKATKLIKKPADDPRFEAFQKLCGRYGIRLRPRGRPRQI